MSRNEMPTPPVEKPAAKKELKDIEVVALQPGFMAPLRIAEGTRFTVKSFEQLGFWMKCVDPEIEALHQKAMREKKDRIRRSAE
jgi:hypothetical protein